MLYYAPAVVADESALSAFGAPPTPVVRSSFAVDRRRNVSGRGGYQVRWVADLVSSSLTNASPPRMRVEDAALRVASRCPRELDAIQTVASVIQRRLTTGVRMEAALERHPRLRARAWLAEVVRDVACGSHSVLEREYLVRVERAHALPPSLRQHRRASATVRYADASFVDHDVEVELDGRMVHDTAVHRHRDLERDLDAVAAGRITVRLGWGQVFDSACQTAARIGLLLARRGWAGRLVSCGPGCLIR